MTIAILKLEAGQTIPRPFNRASSVAEMAECIGYWVACKSTAKLTEREKFANFASDNPATFLTVAALDTETPVYEHSTAKFFAFTEE
jgi:hypothetical protein